MTSTSNIRTAAGSPSRGRQRHITCLVAVVASFVAVLVVPGGAASANIFDACVLPQDSGYLCNFTNTQGGGTKARWQYDNASWGASAVNNNDHSSANRGGQYVAVYNYSSGGTYYQKQYCLAPSTGYTTNPGSAGSANKWHSGSCPA